MKTQEEQQYEARCKKCGECCRVKIRLATGEIIGLNLFCPALNLFTKRCRCYANRLIWLRKHLGIPCREIRDIPHSELPITCAYVPEGACGFTYDPTKLKIISWSDRVFFRLVNLIMRIQFEWKFSILKLR